MQIIENASLQDYCTFKIGGTCSFLINWQLREELPEIISFARAKGLPFMLFGGGSNLVFPDGHTETVMIRCATNNIVRDSESGVIAADAGLRWPLFARFCKEESAWGYEPFYGLPGTVGGALFGNAGCHGLEMKDIVTEYEIFDLDKLEFVRKKLETEAFGYRHSPFHSEKKIITRCWLKPFAEPFGDASEYADFRNSRQPKGLTTGSFFKNPYPEHAGALLDKAGLKGYRLGNVGFSDLHANFMLNYGGATAAEVLSLRDKAMAAVKEKFAISLEPEVRIVSAQDYFV